MRILILSINVKFAASMHTMALMAVNRFCRIVKLANYRRYIYYQEENSIGVSCVFIPVIAIFSGWGQNGSVIIQSKTVLAFMTYRVNHYILCFQLHYLLLLS